MKVGQGKLDVPTAHVEPAKEAVKKAPTTQVRPTSQIVGNKANVPNALSLVGRKEKKPAELYPANGGRRYVRTLPVILEVTEPSSSEYGADIPQSKVVTHLPHGIKMQLNQAPLAFPSSH